MGPSALLGGSLVILACLVSTSSKADAFLEPLVSSAEQWRSKLSNAWGQTAIAVGLPITISSSLGASAVEASVEPGMLSALEDVLDVVESIPLDSFQPHP